MSGEIIKKSISYENEESLNTRQGKKKDSNALQLRFLGSPKKGSGHPTTGFHGVVFSVQNI